MFITKFIVSLQKLIKTIYTMTTTNLGEFGARELAMVEGLLKAQRLYGLPEDFDNSEVVPMMNTYSGNVFLTNSNFDVAMVGDDGELYSFYTSPYNGVEGSFEELMSEYRDMNEEDQTWLEELHKDYYSDHIMDLKVKEWYENITYVSEGQEYYTIEGWSVMESKLDENSDREEDVYNTATDAWLYILESEGFDVTVDGEGDAREISVEDSEGVITKVTWSEDIEDFAYELLENKE